MRLGSSARAGMLDAILPHGPVGSTTGAINGVPRGTRTTMDTPDERSAVDRQAVPARQQLASRGVGTVGGQLPVAVSTFTARKRLGVRMTFQRQPVGHLGQYAPQFLEQLAHIRLHHGTATVKHRTIILVHDLDAQALAGHVQPYLST